MKSIVIYVVAGISPENPKKLGFERYVFKVVQADYLPLTGRESLTTVRREPTVI